MEDKQKRSGTPVSKNYVCNDIKLREGDNTMGLYKDVAVAFGHYGNQYTKKYRKHFHTCKQSHAYYNNSRIHKEGKIVRIKAPFSAYYTNYIY